MKKRKVLKLGNLQTKPPIWSTITAAMALDYWNAPQWIYGAVGLIFIIGWASCIYHMITEEVVDIFDKDPNN